jgi:hypothetical protein
VPFKGTLAAPKTFEMVGGNLTGGGGGLLDPDEPPPQATFHNKLAINPRGSDAQRIFFQNFKLPSARL